MQKELGLNEPMAVPRLEKIVLNMGLGEATQNVKIMDPLVADLAAIAGQKPVTTRAKKSIAAFKVREGMPIGAMVTLRGDTMYEFLDRLISVALPRVRDFRGVSTKSFDGRGNYTLGMRDQLIFAEIDYCQGGQAEGHERHHRDDSQGRQRGARAAEGSLACLSARRRKAIEEIETKWQLLQNESKTHVSRSSRAASTIAASSADGRAPSCASSAYAACASARWRFGEKFPVSSSRAGNSLPGSETRLLAA